MNGCFLSFLNLVTYLFLTTTAFSDFSENIKNRSFPSISIAGILAKFNISKLVEAQLSEDREVESVEVDLRLTAIKSEGLPEVLENKGTWPFTFREQEKKRKIKLGTREQKHSLGNREQQNRRNTFRENGNTRKILLGTREHGPPPPWEAL